MAIIQKKHAFIAVAFLVLIGCKPKTANEPQEEVHKQTDTLTSITKKKMDYTGKTKMIHATKTQLYRWFSFYERDLNMSRIDNQLDILSDSITISSASGNLKGKIQYKEFIKVYEGWRNAHNVEVAHVKNNNGLKTDVQITFQSIQPNSEKNQASIGYTIDLETKNSNELPLLKHIEIKPLEQQKFSSFKDTYPNNRVRALMHYWLFNVEQMNGNSEPFKAVLTHNFELHFSKDNIVNTEEKLDQWIKKAATLVSDTNHFPENVMVTVLGDDMYELNAEFVWRGKSKEGVNLQAHTIHKWLIIDNINEPFAKIKKMEVTYKIPFSPLP